MDVSNRPNMRSQSQNGGPGRGWRGDSEGHAKAGEKGGLVTARKGTQFYRAIGSKGGRVSPGNFKNNPRRASEAGRKGGQARGKLS